MKIKLTAISIGLFLIPYILKSQNYNVEFADKYWFYRERLRQRFIIPQNLNDEDRSGESLPAGHINNTIWMGGLTDTAVNPDNLFINKSPQAYTEQLFMPVNNMHWGDGTKELGWYIGVLATEYQLCIDAGLSTKDVIEELYYAIKAYERLDKKANQLNWPSNDMKGPQNSDVDGFFLRDDVTEDALRRMPLLTGSTVNGTKKINGSSSTFNSALGSYGKKIFPSGDQICNLLMGFALVKKFLPDNIVFPQDPNQRPILSYVQEYTKAIKSYIIRDNFLLYIPPNYQEISVDKRVNKKFWQGQSDGGHNLRGFAVFYLQATEFITGEPWRSGLNSSALAWALSSEVSMSLVYGGNQLVTIGSDHGQSMALILIALANGLSTFKPITITYEPKCVKILGLNICSNIPQIHVFERVNETSKRLYIQSQSNRELYKLLHEVLYDNYQNEFSASFFENILASAPCKGPAYNSGVHQPIAYLNNDQSLPYFNPEAGQGQSNVHYIYSAPPGWRANRFYSIKSSFEGDPSFTAEFPGFDYMLLHNLYAIKYHKLNGISLPTNYVARLELNNATQFTSKNIFNAHGRISLSTEIDKYKNYRITSSSEIKLLPGSNIRSMASYELANPNSVLLSITNPCLENLNTSALRIAAKSNEGDFSNKPHSQDELKDKDAEMLIIPNPTSSYCSIQYQIKEKTRNVEISIINSLGLEIQRHKLDNVVKGINEYLIDFSSMPSGVYSIKIYDGLSVKLKTLIKN